MLCFEKACRSILHPAVIEANGCPYLLCLERGALFASNAFTCLGTVTI
jgi:hypothetical protein